MTDEELNRFAHQLPSLKVSTLRTLLTYREIINSDALELLDAEMNERSKEGHNSKSSEGY